MPLLHVDVPSCSTVCSSRFTTDQGTRDHTLYVPSPFPVFFGVSSIYPWCCLSAGTSAYQQRKLWSRAFPTKHVLPAGKPPAKGKAAAKPASKKQTQSRKRKLDNIHLQAAAAQLHTPNTPASQAAVEPPTAATLVSLADPAVHSGATCDPDLVPANVAGTSTASQPGGAVVHQPAVPEMGGATSAAGLTEEAACVAANSHRSSTKAWQLPDHITQPDSVIWDRLPITEPAVLKAAEDRLQLSPDAVLQQAAPTVGSVNSIAAAEAADLGDWESQQGRSRAACETQPEPDVPENVALPKVESAGTDPAASELCDIQSVKEHQQESAAAAAFAVQQASPVVSASLSGIPGDLAVSGCKAAPAGTRVNKRLPWPHDWPSAAAVGPLQSSTEDYDALLAAPSEAQPEVAAPEATALPLCHYESARPDVLSESPAKSGILSQQPSKPTLSMAPVSEVRGDSGAGKGIDTDPALAGQHAGCGMEPQAVKPQETISLKTCQPELMVEAEGLPSCCILSGVQSHNKYLSSGPSEADLSRVPSAPSAMLTDNQEGTVVMLEGKSLLGLASYNGSESDNDSA